MNIRKFEEEEMPNGFYFAVRGIMLCMIAGQIDLKDGKRIVAKLYKEWKKYYD